MDKNYEVLRVLLLNEQVYIRRYSNLDWCTVEGDKGRELIVAQQEISSSYTYFNWSSFLWILLKNLIFAYHFLLQNIQIFHFSRVTWITFKFLKINKYLFYKRHCHSWSCFKLLFYNVLKIRSNCGCQKKPKMTNKIQNKLKKIIKTFACCLCCH